MFNIIVSFGHRRTGRGAGAVAPLPRFGNFEIFRAKRSGFGQLRLKQKKKEQLSFPNVRLDGHMPNQDVLCQSSVNR